LRLETAGLDGYKDARIELRWTLVGLCAPIQTFWMCTPGVNIRRALITDITGTRRWAWRKSTAFAVIEYFMTPTFFSGDS